MTPQHEHAQSQLTAIDARIRWVLENPAMSDWLKETLAAALRQDPVTVANDLEILQHLIVPRASILAREAVGVRGLS